jgi:hypothetical protein
VYNEGFADNVTSSSMMWPCSELHGWHRTC